MQDELFNILRTKEDGTVAAVLKRLRAGQDVDAIVKLVADGELLLQCSLNSQEHSRYAFPYISTMPAALYLPSNPYSDSLLHHRTVTDSPKPPPSSDAMVEPWRVYDVPYHAATPVEPRLDRVNASRWTLVTSSDNLVQTLLRIYFKCEFPYQCFFHLDSFLDDLVAGRERYCSSLLVNAILAAACVSIATLRISAHLYVTPRIHALLYSMVRQEYPTAPRFGIHTPSATSFSPRPDADGS